jgi:lysophospholipase L1-like esterase
MGRTFPALLSIAAVCAFGSDPLGIAVGGQALAAADASAGDGSGPRPTIPVEKDPARHQEFLEVAKTGDIDLLFLGDSITDFWRGTGKEVWDADFAPLKAANFGIGGDSTEHVIWRIRHGELEGFQPKVIVLMIGTNNRADKPEDVAAGIKTIIDDIKSRQQHTRILLLAIFPCGEKPSDPNRVRNDAVNQIISGYGDGHTVTYLDIGAKFLTPDGTLSREIMGDLLHPTLKGYQIEADAILPTVKELMQEDPDQMAPFFKTPATSPKVARIEAGIANARLDSTAKTLEKLGDDKDQATADDAKVALKTITDWKAGIDAEIAAAHDRGDIYYAAELAAGMEKHYGSTSDEAKAYHAEVADWKKDKAFAAGKDYPRLTAIPVANRTDPQFKKMVDNFVKKYPDTFYAKEAEGLLPEPTPASTK